MNNMEIILLRIGLILAGLILIYCVKLIYTKLVASTTPAGDKLDDYIKKAKELKASEMSYQDRLKYFRQQGLLKKVAEDIIIMADKD